MENSGKNSIIKDVYRKYYLYFMMYSVIGWLYEVFLEVVVYQWGFSNRGVLFGPYCPIYGVGAILFIIILRKVMKKKSPSWFKFVKPLIIFLSCMAIATAIELGASYILEFATGSWPWQTYSDYDINFQARIALSPSVRFGLGGLAFLYILQPLFEKLIGLLSESSLKLLSGRLFAIFMIDIIFTLLF